MSLGIGYEQHSFMNRNARGEPAHRNVAHHFVLFTINHPNSIDSRFGHQQPISMDSQTGWQNAAQSFQPGNANFNLRLHLERMDIDHRNGIIVAICDVCLVRCYDDPGRAGASVRVLAEGQACGNERFHFRRIRVFNIDHRYGIGFLNVGITQAWNVHHVPFAVGSASTYGGFVTGKSKGWKRKS